MKTVKIFDTTLRDGEQSPGCSMNTEEKIQMAKQLERFGVDIIEAGFPIASPDDFKAVQRISKILKKSEVCGLARALEKDIRSVYEATKDAKKPRIHNFLALSDIHLTHKLHLTRDEALRKSVEAVKLAKNLCKKVDFSPEDASRAHRPFLFKALEAVIKAGADTINIPDTVGYETPEEFGDLIHAIKSNVKGINKITLSVHCHNDLGLAVANSLSAVLNGANQIECTVNGIGERAGNAAMEEVVMAIRTRKDIYQAKTNINTRLIYKTSKLLSTITGVNVQPNKAIVGANAFAHESGIHQDGILKERTTYEIMSAEDIGLSSNKLVLGKHSGKHALSERLKELGFEPDKEELNRVFERFKDLADKKKEIFDEDLEAIVSDEYHVVEEIIKLVDVKVHCGLNMVPSAKVVLDIKGKTEKSEAEGAGPVDAVYKAIDKTVKTPNKLLEFSLNAVTEGIDAQAGVIVRVKDKKSGRIFTGRSANTDIVVASTKSYIHALNRILNFESLNIK